MKDTKNGAMRDCLFCSQLEAQHLELFQAQSKHLVTEPTVKAAVRCFMTREANFKSTVLIPFTLFVCMNRSRKIHMF